MRIDCATCYPTLDDEMLNFVNELCRGTDFTALNLEILEFMTIIHSCYPDVAGKDKPSYGLPYWVGDIIKEVLWNYTVEV